MSVRKPFPMRLNGIILLSRYDMDCIDRAIAYIKKNYRDPISAENLALEAGISVKKLQAGLKRETGFTLHDYHFHVRIEEAKKSLSNEDYPLKSIARTCGFKNESHFCKVFKKVTSLTPVEYRYRHPWCIQGITVIFLPSTLKFTLFVFKTSNTCDKFRFRPIFPPKDLSGTAPS